MKLTCSNLFLSYRRFTSNKFEILFRIIAKNFIFMDICPHLKHALNSKAILVALANYQFLLLCLKHKFLFLLGGVVKCAIDLLFFHFNAVVHS